MQFNAAQDVPVEANSLPRTEMSHMDKPKRRKIRISTHGVMLLLLVVAVGMLGVLIYFGFNPPYLYQSNLNQRILNELSELTSVNPYDNPVFSVITDADALREENAIQAEVYKDAQNGDHVIGFSDEIIVYRRPERKIVYEGPGPQAILNQNTESIANDIISKAKSLGLISEDSEETPGLSVITDAAEMQSQDAEFYAQAKENDIIATFAENSVIILYRPDTAEVVNKGNYSTDITEIL